MSKCIRCGVDLIYDKDKNIDFCPCCGTTFSCVDVVDTQENQDNDILDEQQENEQDIETPKCFRCGAGLIYDKDKNIDFCPSCGMVFAHITPARQSDYKKMAKAPIIGAVICFCIRLVLWVLQWFCFEDDISILALSALDPFILLIEQICLIYAFVYSCIDKYHVEHVAVLENEIEDLKKEVEKLKEQK